MRVDVQLSRELVTDPQTRAL